MVDGPGLREFDFFASVSVLLVIIKRVRGGGGVYMGKCVCVQERMEGKRAIIITTVVIIIINFTILPSLTI